MKNGLKLSILIAALYFSTGCDAAGTSNPPAVSQQTGDAQHTELKSKLRQVLRLKIDAIADAPIDGLLQVMTDRGLFYTSKDGKYFMQARIFNLDQDMRDETDAALSEIRLEGVKDFDDSVIEFKAENEKYVVNIFTDISCGYCRKLHNEIDSYNDAGITVRYLAFPRAGLSGQTYDQMVSVWCAEDKQKAMTDAKAGEQVPGKNCATEVNQHYAFGQRIGVNGTPNIILPNGSVIPGYQPAVALKQTLDAM